MFEFHLLATLFWYLWQNPHRLLAWLNTFVLKVYNIQLFFIYKIGANRRQQSCQLYNTYNMLQEKLWPILAWLVSSLVGRRITKWYKRKCIPAHFDFIFFNYSSCFLVKLVFLVSCFYLTCCYFTNVCWNFRRNSASFLGYCRVYVAFEHCAKKRHSQDLIYILFIIYHYI